jgi:hypothetical protein
MRSGLRRRDVLGEKKGVAAHAHGDSDAAANFRVNP